MGTLSLAVRRMGAFFETFPVILIDQSNTVRADISFRRGSSTYGVEQLSIHLSISSGILNGVSYSSGSLVKDYARKAQFGEIFTFKKKTAYSDGLWSPLNKYSGCILHLIHDLCYNIVWI